jgi:hypothetical protein
MSAGGDEWSHSSIFMLAGGDRPPTFHVATNILSPQIYKNMSFINSLLQG